MGSNFSIAISVVVPAWNRQQSLLTTLDRIKSCRPAPAEILVHIDGAAEDMIRAVRSQHPDVILLQSEVLLGPGGGRDVLIRAASHNWVATFDDDSYPESSDYFARVWEDVHSIENLAVLAANVLPESHPSPVGFERLGEYIGCGCVFAKSWYLKTVGFVPRPVAYGMEEADISLQLHAVGGVIVRDAALRVVHDRESSDRFGDLFHQELVINCAMLPFLRYPWFLFPLVLWHLSTRILWEVRTGWLHSAMKGLFRAPVSLARHLLLRAPVSATAVAGWYFLKWRTPIPWTAATRATTTLSAK